MTQSGTGPAEISFPRTNFSEESLHSTFSTKSLQAMLQKWLLRTSATMSQTWFLRTSATMLQPWSQFGSDDEPASISNTGGAGVRSFATTGKFSWGVSREPTEGKGGMASCIPVGMQRPPPLGVASGSCDMPGRPLAPLSLPLGAPRELLCHPCHPCHPCRLWHNPAGADSISMLKSRANRGEICNPSEGNMQFSTPKFEAQAVWERHGGGKVF